MSEPAVADTRARILQAALAQFAAHGYHRTSIRALAESVGLTKSAVLYHFRSKEDIVTALVEPILDDLETLLRSAADTSADAGRTVLEGMLDIWFEHRYLLRVNLRDLALTLSTASGPFERFQRCMLEVNELVAGPGADLIGRVRAAQAIAMLSDPVVVLADAPDTELRSAILAGVDRLLDTPAEAPPPPWPTPRTGRGRPRALTPADAERAAELHAAGEPVAAIAAQLGVSRATVYRHLKSDQ